LVINGSTGFPLPGVGVKLLGTNTSESSNAVGEFKMGQLQNGSFTAQVSKSGFVTQNIPVTLNNGVLTTLNVTLWPIVLPVQLTRFEVDRDDHDALLQWETAAETDNAGFDVQYSANGGDWETRGFVAAKGDIDLPARYALRVPDLPPGVHFFRLRQIDLDGKSVFSDIRTLKMERNGLRIALRPNQTDDIVELYCFAEAEIAGAVEVLYTDGSVAVPARAFDAEGEAILPLHLGHLPGGLYFIAVTAAGKKQVLRVVKR
jgi:hypothetical protein